MNPLTNTLTRTSANPLTYPKDKDRLGLLTEKPRPSKPSGIPLSLRQMQVRAKHETSLISNLAGNYYHTFIHRLYSQFNQQNKIGLLYESQVYEILDVSLKIMVLGPNHTDIWSVRNQITSGLCRGSVFLENQQELFFYFSFLDKEKTAIEILDIPFIMLSLVDIHQKDMISYLKGEPAKFEGAQLPFDIRYELATFKLMIDYLSQRGGIEPGKVSVKEY